MNHIGEEIDNAIMFCDDIVDIASEKVSDVVWYFSDFDKDA